MSYQIEVRSEMGNWGLYPVGPEDPTDGEYETEQEAEAEIAELVACHDGVDESWYRVISAAR